MDAKFTPGPWSIGKRVNLVKSTKGNIADCLFTHSKSAFKILPDPDECIANARLIAAAPELLLALETLVSLSRDENATAIDEGNAWTQARAAIAKATQP